MKKMLSILALFSLAVCAMAELSDLSAVYRNGQVFMTWRESNLPQNARLTVWGSSQPITAKNFTSTEKLAELLNPGSAEDWWLDASNFVTVRSKKAKSEENFAGNVADVGAAAKKGIGFVITDGGKPIPANGGLHVHTPNAKQVGARYFAVSCEVDGKPCGFVALKRPIVVKKEPIRAIRIAGKDLAQGSCKGLPLAISLHGRGGGVGVDKKGEPVGTHLMFSTADFAWREGIPFKFTIKKHNDYVEIFLNDRVWIGRVLKSGEHSDPRDVVPAISTFWYGYNPNIAKSILGPKFVCDNYTERYILEVIRWAREYLGTAPAATYIYGGSMGGTGTVQMLTHYPNVFAAGSAIVPVYSYTWAKSKSCSDSAKRIVCSTGKFTAQNPATTPDGSDLLERLDGAANIGKAAVDMPPLFSCNGRTDRSMPWVNNPPFFRAANAARQCVFIFWNDGGHHMKNTIEDMYVGYNARKMFRFRLDTSFPAFSNSTDNKNYGNGDEADGDMIGWINRGWDWKVVSDSPKLYAIEISVAHKDIKYPVTADITLRRRQQFKPAAGEAIVATIGAKKQFIKLDANGLLTLEKVTFTDGKPLRITLVRK